jgi:hypothetical protein
MGPYRGRVFVLGDSETEVADPECDRVGPRLFFFIPTSSQGCSDAQKHAATKAREVMLRYHFMKAPSPVHSDWLGQVSVSSWDLGWPVHVLGVRTLSTLILFPFGCKPLLRLFWSASAPD